MIKTLFLANMRKYWILIVCFFLILAMYSSIFVSIFEPDDAGSLAEMFDLFPEGLMKAFGFDSFGTTLLGSLDSFLYGFIMFTFPMIFSIVLAHGLVGKLADKGSMAYLLATPHKRIKIVATQAVFLIVSQIVVIAATAALIIAMSEGLFPGMLEMGKFIKLNVVTLLCILAVSGVSFLFSCLCNEAKFSLAFGAGIPIIFIVVTLLRSLSDSLDWMKYLSFYSFIDSAKIFAGGSYFAVACLVLTGIILVLYGSAAAIFNKKSFIV